MHPAASEPTRTYGMPERSDRLDFYIRDQTTRPAITEPHRHDYFQIQINLGGDTVQRIGGATRPFPRGAVAFILPYRLHLIPHPPESRFMVINFSQQFLRADLEDDPLDLEDVSVHRAVELAPFRFQEYLDFVLTDADLAEVRQLLARMLEVDGTRGFGATALLRGYLLQLIGIVCARHAEPLLRLADSEKQRTGRRDALARVMRHIRAQIASDGLSLTSAAAAAFLSPNYLAHLIKKETGRTFTELVTDRRMALAQSLLAHSAKRVGEVAQAVGFRDEAYFSRRFRRTTGMSPSDYRSAHHATADAQPSTPANPANAADPTRRDPPAKPAPRRARA
jgi:AraC-like DNA-binding protein